MIFLKNSNCRLKHSCQISNLTLCLLVSSANNIGKQFWIKTIPVLVTIFLRHFHFMGSCVWHICGM